MKLPFAPFLLIVASSYAYGASSIILEVGPFEDSIGDPVFNGVWILVLDSSNTSLLPGALSADASSPDTNLSNPTAAAEAFSGLTLNQNNLIGGSKILGIGNITPENDPDLPGYGLSNGSIEFADGEEGLAYGIYWIMGFTVGDTLPTTGAFEIGGIFRSSTAEFSEYGTFSPPAPFDNVITVFDVTGVNAIIVTAIPEPSTFLLSTLGALALLRRSRKS